MQGDMLKDEIGIIIVIEGIDTTNSTMGHTHIALGRSQVWLVGGARFGLVWMLVNECVNLRE